MVPSPQFIICNPQFMFGTPVVAYIQYCIKSVAPCCKILATGLCDSEAIGKHGSFQLDHLGGTQTMIWRKGNALICCQMLVKHERLYCKPFM